MTNEEAATEIAKQVIIEQTGMPSPIAGSLAIYIVSALVEVEIIDG